MQLFAFNRHPQVYTRDGLAKDLPPLRPPVPEEIIPCGRDFIYNESVIVRFDRINR